MALTRQVITSLLRDGTDMLGTKSLAIKIADESIVSGSLLTVESNHFCVLKSRGAVLNVYDTGQYALVTAGQAVARLDRAGPSSGARRPGSTKVIYINRSKLLVRSEGHRHLRRDGGDEAYQVDYYIHVDSKQDALDLITHLPFNGTEIDTAEVADYAGPAIEQAINQIVQVTRMEQINEHITEIRESVKEPPHRLPQGLRHSPERPEGADPAQGRAHARVDLAAGDRPLAPGGGALLSGALRMAEKGLVSAPNAACGEPFHIGGQPQGYLFGRRRKPG